MEPVTLPHYSAFRAAGVAQDYINFKRGGPYRYFETKKVTSCNKEGLPGVGTKYYLVFTMKDALNKEPSMTCTATVTYNTAKQTAPDVTYTLEPEPQNYTAEKDQEFYSKMKSRTEPLVAENIPDKFGNVPPDMEPVRNLSLAACGFVKWQHATEDTYYLMTVINKVKLEKSNDSSLNFQYEVLIHQRTTEEMERWSIDVDWRPSELIVKEHHRLPKINPDESSSRQT